MVSSLEWSTERKKIESKAKRSGASLMESLISTLLSRVGAEIYLHSPA